MKLHNIYRFVINFFYPNTCPRCGTIIGYNDPFCEECEQELTRIDEPFSIGGVDKFAAYYLYDDVSDMVVHFKNDPCGNSAYAFAYGIFRAIQKAGFAEQLDEIAFIPMTKKERRKRGYNQSELIARELHFMLGIPYRRGLVKNRVTRHQKELSEVERRTNLIGAFSAVKGVRYDGKTVLVIDDVCTTGSTISEAARALREAGAEHVCAATFSRTHKTR